jgi:hypothetical protein
VVDWGRFELRDIELVDRAGTQAAHFETVRVQVDPIDLMRHRNRIERLVIDGVTLDLPAIQRVYLRELSSYLRARQTWLRVDSLWVRRGRLEVDQAPLGRLQASRVAGRFWLVSHSQWGRVDLLDLDGRLVTARGVDFPLSARTGASWEPGTLLALERAQVRVGDSRVSGRARLAGRIDAEVDEQLAAADLHRFWPPEDPPADLSGHVSLHGPRQAVRIDLLLHPGEGTLHLHGLADWPERAVSVFIDNDRVRGAFFPKRPPFVLNGRVEAQLRWAEGGVEGPASIGPGAHGFIRGVPVENVAANARLEGHSIGLTRATLDVPGATVGGHAHLSFKGQLAMALAFDVTKLSLLLKAVKELRQGGVYALPVDPQSKVALHIEGKLQKAPKQKARFKVTSVRLGRPSVRRNAEQL